MPYLKATGLFTVAPSFGSTKNTRGPLAGGGAGAAAAGGAAVSAGVAGAGSEAQAPTTTVAATRAKEPNQREYDRVMNQSPFMQNVLNMSR
jgi:hypothetical protein